MWVLKVRIRKFVGCTAIVFVSVLSLSACAPKQLIWDADLTSTTKQAVRDQALKVSYWSRRPDESAKAESQVADKSKEQSGIQTQIDEFLATTHLPFVVTNKIVKRKIFQSTSSSSERELRIIVGLDLSDDLQIASVRASALLVGDSDEDPKRLCYDKFDVIAHTGIQQNADKLAGGDMRLSNNFILLLGKFDSMAQRATDLIERFYFNWETIETPIEATPRNLLTHGQRLLVNTASTDHLQEIIAYKSYNFNKRHCQSVHLVSYDRKEDEILQKLAHSELKDRRQRASNQRFKSQQELRNQQIMFKRMRERALGK